MNEKQLMLSIGRLTGTADSLATALQQIRPLLEAGLGGRVLLQVMPKGKSSGGTAIPSEAARFLDQKQGLPYQSVHAVPLRAGGRELGKLIAIFALDCAHGAVLKRIATFAGEQMGTMLVRICLSETRDDLRAELADIKDNLARRRAVQRAAGFLAIRWGIDNSTAKQWMLRRVEDTGLSILDVALAILGEQEDAEREEPKVLPAGQRSLERKFFRPYNFVPRRDSRRVAS